MGGMGDAIEFAMTRLREGVAARFPTGNRPDALAPIGRERRIRRGPGEDSFTYAARLRTWLDSHRTRGNTYSLLTQIYDYFRVSLGVPIDVVGNSGVRHMLSPTGEITRKAIVWNGDGDPTRWARLFVMINLPDATFPVPILQENGEPALDVSGNPTFTSVALDSLSDFERAIICAVPKEWTAAHIETTKVVLLFPGARLWGYESQDAAGADGVPTWGADWGTWQTSDPVTVTC